MTGRKYQRDHGEGRDWNNDPIKLSVNFLHTPEQYMCGSDPLKLTKDFKK